MIDRAEKREEDRIQDELNKQKALSDEDYERVQQGFNEQERSNKESKEDAERNDEEIKPIGKGVFGNIYDQFRGKVKEAVDFLLKHKEGDLLGVFHREEIGDIDLIWGSDSENQGLDHIIKKHINKLHDFKDVDEAVTIIEDVINNGEMKPIINNTEKVSFEKDGYKVSVKRKVRDNQGEVIGSKNWVVTAFDTTKTQRQKETETLSEKTLTTPPFNQKADGVTLPSNNVSVSAGKDTTKSENEQEKEEKNDNDTLKEDRSVKNITESESKRKGMLGVVLDALRKAIGKDNVITDNEEAQRVIDEANGIVRPERVTEESEERAKRVKDDWDLIRELKEITGAEGYGTNTAYVRGTSQDGTTYEVRVGNHIANFENFDRNNEELPQKIVSIVVMDEKFDKKTARYKSSEAINRELEEKDIDSEFQQIIIDDVKNKSQEEIRQAIEDVLFGMQVLKERGRLLFDSESAISYSKVQKNILETVSISNNKKHQQTVISSNDGAKILQNLDTLVKKIENIEQAPIKTFIGEVAKAIGAKRYGSKSEYATFETKNGKIITIRLADHNAKVSGFDHKDHSNGISIVISAKGNKGITDDGNAHIVEYYYDAIKLRRAEGKPLAEIVRSIKQSLYSGEFKDTTGLAEREEVNASGNKLKLHKVQFLKTKNGEVYGFTVGGKVYIDEKIADASTPIHEYTHLWASALRKVNPEEWKNIVSLMKKQTHLWDKVKNDYPELKSDDEIADEVLAHYSGERGKKLLDEEYDKIRGNNKLNIFDKAKMLQAINNVREALRKFWKGVADLFNIHFTSAEEVADKVLSDLLEGVNPNEVKSEEEEIIEKAKADGTYKTRGQEL